MPGWPEPPAAWVAGWYRRGAGHLAAPAGVRELVQAPGEGFGPGDHPTTALCLEALAALPAGPALDAGCGSGLLAQAWARLGRGEVLAVEADPAAADQARRSLRLAGLERRCAWRGAGSSAWPPPISPGAWCWPTSRPRPRRALLRRLPGPPPGALLSGLRPGEAAPLVRGYRRLGLRVVGAARRGRFERWVLVRA